MCYFVTVTLLCLPTGCEGLVVVLANVFETVVVVVSDGVVVVLGGGEELVVAVPVTLLQLLGAVVFCFCGKGGGLPVADPEVFGVLGATLGTTLGATLGAMPVTLGRVA